MMAGYQDDPYLDFAVRAGLAPAGATKATHKGIRQMCKAVVLGTQYGMREYTLANQIGVLPCRARQLLQSHQEVYRDYWEWVDAALNQAVFRGYIDTVFGWRLSTAEDARSTTIQNFPCQANGFRNVAYWLHHGARGGPIHYRDSPRRHIVGGAAGDAGARHTPVAGNYDGGRSAGTWGGFPVRTDAEYVRYPNRYFDERGRGYVGNDDGSAGWN